jgi:hypothetical protein
MNYKKISANEFMNDGLIFYSKIEIKKIKKAVNKLNFNLYYDDNNNDNDYYDFCNVTIYYGNKYINIYI